MKVKLDENLGQSHAELVRAAGHVATRVTEQGLSGAKDPTVWQHVCDTGRFFVTLDLDFSDVRRFDRALTLASCSSERAAKAEKQSRVFSGVFWQSTGWSPWLAVWQWRTRAERAFGAPLRGDYRSNVLVSRR